MKKYNNCLILLLLICSLSCNSSVQNVPFSKSLIKSIAEEQSNLPSRFSNLLFFCKCLDNEILSLSVYGLKEVYLNEFGYTSYYDFLTNLLNQKIAIKCRDQSQRFKMNENVRKRYKDVNLNEFLDFYCTKEGNNLFGLKNSTTNEQQNTVLYFLFINNYLISFDDYSGIYVVRKNQ